MRDSLFDLLDVNLVKHLMIEFLDCRSLLALSLTSSGFRKLILDYGGVCDELLFRISPLLTTHRRISSKLPPPPRFSSKLQPILFYELISKAKKQFKVSCGEQHTIIAVPQEQNNESFDKVFTFGSGANGRLGTGASTDSESALEINFPFEEKLKVVSVVGGKDHSLVLFSNGRLFGFGSNSHGQLGPNVATGDHLIPVDLQLDSVLNTLKVKVVMISCSNRYSAVVLSDGAVLVFGRIESDVDQLQFIETQQYRNSKFKCILSGDIRPSDCIIEASAGYHHLLLLTKNGSAFALGSNSRGQLGVGGEIPFAEEPLEVSFSKVEVKQVAAGEKHSMLLTRDGCLFTWGDGRRGQLGNGRFNTTDENYKPTQVKLPGGVFPVIITCGNNHSIVLDIDSRVTAFGSNQFGQTAVRSFFAIERPAIVSQFQQCNKKSKKQTEENLFCHIAAGNGHTAVLGVGKVGLYMFGDRNSCGGGGFLRTSQNRLPPTKVDLEGGVEIGKKGKVFYTERYHRH